VITAVDSSIIIDVFEPDPEHGPSSREALRHCLRKGSMVACDVVWAEVATAFGHAQARAVDALREIGIAYSPMTEEAALRAAECWYRFRKRSGRKEPIVADFLIGGHALVQADRLLTRDRGFYRDYFKPLTLVLP
jgi:predicted nucleic acid-binding protein